MNKMMETLREEKTGLSLSVVNRLLDLSLLVKNYSGRTPELKAVVREWRERLFDAKTYAQVLILSQLLSENGMMQTAGKMRADTLLLDTASLNAVHEAWGGMVEILGASSSVMDQSLFSDLASITSQAVTVHSRNDWKGVTPSARKTLENLIATGGEKELKQWVEYMATLPEIPESVRAEVQEKVVSFGRTALAAADWKTNVEIEKAMLTRDGAKFYNKILDQSLNEDFQVKVNGVPVNAMESKGLLFTDLNSKEDGRKVYVARVSATLRYRMD
jgi:hypothetical protein